MSRSNPHLVTDGRSANLPAERVRIRIHEDVMDGLRTRLRCTTWPSVDEERGWEFGVPASYLRELVDYWASTFDWAAQEATLNRYQHYRTVVDGVPIHFMYRPSAVEEAEPLILSHGWPWTFWHWSPTVDALADPSSHGGDPADAFHLIVPSLPGFGFSAPLPERSQLNFWRIADLWDRLMTSVLGYSRYAAAGCDVGALVTAQLGHKYADHLSAIHIGSGQKLDLFNGWRAWNLSGTQGLPEGLPPEVRDRVAEFDRRFGVHLAAHVLAPDTIAYALSDSPVGMLAWLLERWTRWSDCSDDVESVFDKDELLTQATIYWATNTIGSSIRTYAHNNRFAWSPSHNRTPVVEAPTGITFVAYENPPGVSTEQRVNHFLSSDRAAWFNHKQLTVHRSGGHFIPWEIPEEWVDDLRRTIRPYR